MLDIGEYTVVNEGILARKADFCPFCRRSGTSIFESLRDCIFKAPGVWALFHCRECGLVWINPRPFSGSISQLYLEYHTHCSARSKPRYQSVRNYIATSILASSFGYAEVARNRFHLALGKALSYYPPFMDRVGLSVMMLDGQHKGSILDVGSGNGEFLLKMTNLGWETTGVEPDEIAARVARDRYKVNVLTGHLEDLNLQSSSFQAITLNHVIEHLHAPTETLKECSRILKLGGEIIVTTPNNRSLGARIFGKYWRGWEVPRHLFVFSPTAIRQFFLSSGFTDIQVRTSSRMARELAKASYLMMRCGGQSGKRRVLTRFLSSAASHFLYFIELVLSSLWDVGEEIVLIARK